MTVDLFRFIKLLSSLLNLRSLFQFQVLQQKVGVLEDSAHQNDERYTRVKAENAALQARVIMLEEQLRDTEYRYEEKLQVRTLADNKLKLL